MGDQRPEQQSQDELRGAPYRHQGWAAQREEDWDQVRQGVTPIMCVGAPWKPA